MQEEKDLTTKKCSCRKSGNVACGGGVYGLAFIGALVYYIQQADSFQSGLIGFLKALVWPALVIYELLKFLQM